MSVQFVLRLAVLRRVPVCALAGQYDVEIGERGEPKSAWGLRLRILHPVCLGSLRARPVMYSRVSGVGGECHRRVIFHIKELQAVQDGAGE